MSPRPLPAAARRSLRLYNLVFPFAFFVLLPSYLLRMVRRGNFRAHFWQRFGFYHQPEVTNSADQCWTWIQSISVGETFIALKLARELHRQDPETRLYLSTTTTTGFAMAAAEASEWLRPIYNPIDLRWIVRRAVRLLNPTRFIVIEGGVWPNLLTECYRRRLPLTLANARLSPRSESRFRRCKSWVAPLFSLFDLITVPDQEDVTRWETLEIPANKVRVTGSIKFDQPALEHSSRVEEFRELLTKLGINAAAPIIVAGSTFAGEEILLAQSYLTLRATHPDLLLILVPRHIERTADILHELMELPLKVVRRSALTNETKPELLVVDTTGELRDWYGLATIAFVGKSLTAIGGQNPAEPAGLGKPILFGPHMENFAGLTQHLLTTRAALQLASPAQLTDSLHQLLSDPALRAAMAKAGPGALAAHAGATQRTAKMILTLSEINS